MIPLWASAIFPVQSTCGWAFTFDGAPWVAHRVWAKPVEPFNGGGCASGFGVEPLSLLTCRALPPIATPAPSDPPDPTRLQPAGPCDDAGSDHGLLDDARGTEDDIVHQDRIRDGRQRADPNVLPEARRRQEDGIRTDLTSGADRQRALEVRARADHAAVPDRHAAADRDRRLNRPRAALGGRLQSRRL